MLSNASMQQKKQNATCLGSALTRTPRNLRLTIRLPPTGNQQKFPIPLYLREKLYTRSPFRVKKIDVGVAYTVLNCAGHGSRFHRGATAELRCN